MAGGRVFQSQGAERAEGAGLVFLRPRCFKEAGVAGSE